MSNAHPDDGTKLLDVITIGRASVDLYGQQIGTKLEDIGSFAKSVGGCPTNIAVGTARLGLKSALITRVGNEQMGRFIREQLAREGVETSGIATDPGRLTALVLLSVEAEGVSPMIFYRTDCADMALDESNVDEALIASARSIVVTGETPEIGTVVDIEGYFCAVGLSEADGLFLGGFAVGLRKVGAGDNDGPGRRDQVLIDIAFI